MGCHMSKMGSKKVIIANPTKKVLFNWIFCFIFAFVTLLICSKNSFLYVFNDWVDANCFFTVGKSMVHGILPYKELFEQKGPLLFLIYGLGSLITPTSFHGVFVFEVLSFTVFNYYILKLLDEIIHSKYSYLTLLILDAIIVSRVYFVHGGSAEEFCLPYLAYSLYWFFKYTNDAKYNRYALFMNGLMAGIIVMIKYNLIGLSFAWMALLFLYLVKNKHFMEAFTSCLWFLLGMLTPFAIFSIYFLINDGFTEFINVYFIVNATAYAEKMVLNSKIITIGFSLEKMLSMDMLTQILLGLGIINIYFNKNNKMSKVNKIFVAFAFIMLCAGIFIGGRRYNYYLLPALIFLVYGIDFGYDLLVKFIDAINFKKLVQKLNWHFSFKPKYAVATLVVITIALAGYTLSTSSNIKFMSKTKSDYFQYTFAEDMSKYQNPTLLNYGWLDLGLYTTSGIYPSLKFFHVLNIDDDQMPEIRGTQNLAVAEGKPNFLVIRMDYDLTMDEKEAELAKYEKYEVVDTKDQEFEGNMNTYYLLKEKEYNRVLAQE
jgi:hypothetical protein